MLSHFLVYGFVSSFAQLPEHFSGLMTTVVVALFFYTGPESILPVASGLAAVIGFLLIIWQRFQTFLSRVLQSCQQRLTRSFRRQ